jgi:hypothetical protein
MQVLGNMKGVIAAGISIALFKNPVTAKGMLGYLITVIGVVAYSEVSPHWPCRTAGAAADQHVHANASERQHTSLHSELTSNL